MNEKQQRILEINKNTNLTQQEKTKQIQEVMMSTYVAPVQEKTVCTHYKKQCDNFHFTCCDNYFDCCRCHLENNEHTECINKIKIDTIQCKNCCTVQTPSLECIQCGTKFSRSYCGICNIWSEKFIFHCDSCGICRVGDKENFFHCDSCGICWKNNVKEKHTCIGKISTDSSCVFCSENAFSSQEHSVQIRCGHRAHSICMVKSFECGNYKCPICRKSMQNMFRHWLALDIEIAHHPLPQELQKKVNIVCYDCEKESLNVNFHFFGIKCLDCGGYNTSQK